MSIIYNEILQHTINRRLFSTSKLVRNHYKVLKLSRNCTAKEIKESFIKLSKENHPDVNKNKDAHKKFLQINEAYKILSKQKSRQLYDLGFSRSDIHGASHNVHVYYGEEFGSDPWKDPLFYHNRDKSQDKYYEDKGYYGIKGVEKVPNSTIVILCLLLTAIGVGLQVLAIKYSYTLKRSELIRRSDDAKEMLQQIQEVANKNGNEVQLQLLIQQFKDAKKYK